jgi:phosphonatase-like hydrolase
MKQPAYALVVFDVAGTTVLDGDIVIDAMAAALEAGHASVDRAAIRNLMGIPKPAAIAQLLLQHPLARNGGDAGRVDRIHHDFLQRLHDDYHDHPAVREAYGARDTFATLRNHGVKVALDTGFDRPTVNLLLGRLGWTVPGLIDCVVTSDEVYEGRPSPGLIRRAMQLTDVSEPRTVVKVGDTPADIQSGRAAGCGLVVGVSYGTHVREELLRHEPTAVIDDLSDLLPMVLGR